MVDHLLRGLRPIRRVRRFTLIEMAEVIGVKPNSYARFEAGDRRIYFDKAAILAKRLGVRLDDLTKALDEQDAALLCDQRDKEAIANGTFNQLLWPSEPSASVPAPPSAVPPPPPLQVPPPPPLDLGDLANAEQQLQDWER